MGVNAIHRLGPLLTLVDAYEPRTPEIDGCQYRESLQAVAVGGGVAGNVVPDTAEVTLGHRYAPDRDAQAAEAALRELLAPVMGEGDRFEVTEQSPAALPGLGHPVLQRLIGENQLEVRAKLGWTDVAFFAERGIPAANYGPRRLYPGPHRAGAGGTGCHRVLSPLSGSAAHNRLKYSGKICINPARRQCSDILSPRSGQWSHGFTHVRSTHGSSRVGLGVQ